MGNHHISRRTLKFLTDLRANNYREWFQNHRDQYEMAQQNMIDFTASLIQEMDKYDHLVPRSPKQSLFRIYRDVRFSKDKTPYKQGFSGRLKRATKHLRGSYFFRIKPGNQSLVAGGFWGPERHDLLRIRQEIAADSGPLRKIIKTPAFKRNFGQLSGDELKTAPRGFAKEHPDVDLLRKKQFLLIRHFSDEQVLSPGFLRATVHTYKAMRPFFNYMSMVLTTDENGVPIV